MLIAVSSTEAVELKIDPSAVLATREWVENKLKSGAVSVSIDGPSPVFAGSVNHYQITNYHSLSEYQVSTDLGEASITGDTITLLLADTDTQSPATLRIIRDGILNMFEIEVIEKSIAQPQILTPVNDATDVAAPVIVTSTEYASLPAGIGTHSKSHWKLTSDYAGQNIVWESFDDEINLTELQLASSIVGIDTTYYIHVRHFSAALGYSEWSLPSKFTTAESFVGIGWVMPDGGIVFARKGGDWLVCAPATMRAIRKWGLYGTDTSITNGYHPGNSGKQNTDILVSSTYKNINDGAGSVGSPAAKYARDLGYDLPSSLDIDISFANAGNIDGYDTSGGSATLVSIFSGGKDVWTSDEMSKDTAITFKNDPNGHFQAAIKSSDKWVIPVKRIPV